MISWPDTPVGARCARDRAYDGTNRIAAAGTERRLDLMARASSSTSAGLDPSAPRAQEQQGGPPPVECSWHADGHSGPECSTRERLFAGGSGFVCSHGLQRAQTRRGRRLSRRRFPAPSAIEPLARRRCRRRAEMRCLCRAIVSVIANGCRARPRNRLRALWTVGARRGRGRLERRRERVVDEVHVGAVGRDRRRRVVAAVARRLDAACTAICRLGEEHVWRRQRPADVRHDDLVRRIRSRGGAVGDVNARRSTLRNSTGLSDSFRTI
jgi:hypothetical protein